jgi:uncharacterized membrane protein HdeD (DUF308 family)
MLRHPWWALAIRGFAALVFGLLAFVMPGVTIALLVLWFGAYALVDGIFSIIAAWRAPDGRAHWGSLLIEGIAGIVVGVLTFFWPGITATVLVFLVGGWAVVTGVFEIVAAIRLRRLIANEWALIAMGVLSVVFGLFIFVAPIAGAIAIAYTIGAYAIIFGVLLLVLAFRMRSWLRDHDTLPGAALNRA